MWPTMAGSDARAIGSSLIEFRAHDRDECVPARRQRNPEPRAHDLDIALAPEALGTADDELLVARHEAQLEQRDRRHRLGCEPHRDQVSALETVELPLDLLAKLRFVDRLSPRRVPLLAARIQDHDVAIAERGDELALPVFGRAHVDRSGKKDRWYSHDRTPRCRWAMNDHGLATRMPP